MADERRNRRFCKAEIVGKAGEAVAQHMRCDAGQIGAREDLLPLPGQSAKWGVRFPTREDERTSR